MCIYKLSTIFVILGLKLLGLQQMLNCTLVTDKLMPKLNMKKVKTIHVEKYNNTMHPNIIDFVTSI